MVAKLANVLREWVDLNDFLFALCNGNLFDLCFTDATEAIGQCKGYKAGVSIWTTNCFKFYGTKQLSHHVGGSILIEGNTQFGQTITSPIVFRSDQLTLPFVQLK
jgi:hypothetical protein